MTQEANYSQIIGADDYIRMMGQHVHLKESDKAISRAVNFYISNTPRLFEVVELGCGPVRITPLFTGLHTLVTAVDHDSGFLAFADDYIKRYNLGISLIFSDILTYQHRKAVEIFISQGVHHHIPKGKSTQDYLRNVLRQLTPGGIYIVSDEMLPHYDTEEERRIRVVIWYTYVITIAQTSTHYQLAREEAKTLLDDLAEGIGDSVFKTDEQINLVLQMAPRISAMAVANNHKTARELAVQLLTALQFTGGLISKDSSLSLSRRDYKICHVVFSREVQEAGLRIIGVKTIGPIQTIGGFGIYTLGRA